ncbi:MAG: Mrp/NBP35 family ATP-binding protein [Bacteroidales bacterium]|nr:Mrp/NBP35 family ATP-binding protein [Bacteroidales bacterium]
MDISRESVLNILGKVIHPASGKPLPDSGVIEKVEVQGKTIHLVLKFQKATDPLASSIKKAAQQAIETFLGPGIDLHIDIETPQVRHESPEESSPLSKIKNIIAIASGKGGVGKSTIAVNLAVGTALRGARVGLIDADVYGPSIPRMFSSEDLHPFMKKENGKEIFVPVEKYGVKVLSIGYFVAPSDALIWRGPMATSALRQLLHQTDWGELDYLYIDLPPGTGDIHLTLVQEVPVTGAVIVSTPQEVALADVVKGINMFENAAIKVPVLGLVENMSWFTPPELPDHKYFIFGKNGGKALAEKLKLPLLGQIPVVESICDDSDHGHPSVMNQNSPVGKSFMDLVDQVMTQVDIRNKTMDPTHRVNINR